jgi:hypothetical protein
MQDKDRIVIRVGACCRQGVDTTRTRRNVFRLQQRHGACRLCSRSHAEALLLPSLAMSASVASHPLAGFADGAAASSVPPTAATASSSRTPRPRTAGAPALAGDEPQDTLQFVERHTLEALQMAWAVEKQCDVALRLKRHTAATHAATTEEVLRERLRFVVSVVTEQAPSDAKPTAAGLSTAGVVFEQHVLLRATLRGEGGADDDGGAGGPAVAVDATTRDEDDPFAVDLCDDVTTVVQKLTVAYQVSSVAAGTLLAIRHGVARAALIAERCVPRRLVSECVTRRGDVSCESCAVPLGQRSDEE